MKQFYRAGLLAAAVMFMLLGFATDTKAQSDPAVYNGYQLGYGAGSNDRAYGRGYDVDDHGAYRDADSGYSGSGYRSKGDYERVFRGAFLQGYRDGFSGAPRRSYYSGDVFNYGGTVPGNNGYYYNNRRVRDRQYYPRHRNRDRVRVYVTPSWPY
jgi:hypothetical protein